MSNPGLPPVEAPTKEISPEDKLGQQFAEIISRAEVDLSDAIAEFVETLSPPSA